MKWVGLDDDLRFVDCHDGVRPGELLIYGSEERTGEPLELVLTLNADRTSVRIGGEDYSLSGLECANVALPGTSAEFSLTAFTATCLSGGRAGAMLIAVNCVREPPVLSIAARFESSAPESWSWTIDHRVQHRVLEHLQPGGRPLSPSQVDVESSDTR